MASTVSDSLRYWATTRPDEPALRFRGATTTWSSLASECDRFAQALASSYGVRAGDHVALHLHNSPAFVVAVLALTRLGAVGVPINARLTTHEVAALVVDARCRLAITEPDLQHHLATTSASATQVLTLDVDADGIPSTATLCSATRTVVFPVRSPDDPVLLCFTSGTTGVAKGALVTSRNLWTSAVGLGLVHGCGFNDRIFVNLPLTVTGPLLGVLRLGIVLGATTVLERGFEAARYLSIVVDERITVLSGVPIPFEDIARLPEFATVDLSALRLVIVGGAPVTPDLISRYNERGIVIAQAYGCTESTSAAVVMPPGMAADRPGAAGLPLPGTSMRIVDESDNELPAQALGEIVLAGEAIVSEYWDNPAETSLAMRGGWFHTGDLGVVDDDGVLRVVGRKKDVLISGGLNVYPAEIERALSNHPGVAEVAVVRVPDDRWGEVPMAVVVPAAAGLDPLSLWSQCVEQLADFKRPKYLLRVDALPRLGSGKVDKLTLQAQCDPLPPEALELRRVASRADP